MPKQTRPPSPRFGIAEWFGRDILDLTPKERGDIALDLLRPKRERSERLCPFQARKQGAKCSKEGGVCSLRRYAPDQSAETEAVMAKPVDGPAGALRVTCPYRFHHELEVLRWVGETILGDENPLIAAEVGFLGIKRNEETLEPFTYAERLPEDLSGRQVYIIDPMLATGGTLIDSINYVFERGAAEVTAICLIGAPEGLKAVEKAVGDKNVNVVLGALDEKLNEVGYIVPGLGDAGDRLYGTAD
jgi:phosphoribosylpyrophosphate synthetase